MGGLFSCVKHGLGADFADALHLAHTKALPFYTFDERFCKKAIKESIAPAINIL